MNEEVINQLNFAQISETKRVGSIVDIDPLDAGSTTSALRKKGFKTRLVEGTRGCDILYYKEETPEVRRAITLYQKYMNNNVWVEGAIYDGLTIPEHQYLDKVFGMSPNEIEQHIKELKQAT